MGKVNAVINVMTVSDGTVKQVNLYDSSEDIEKKKEFTYAGAVCYAAITEDASSDDYKDYYSGWTYNAANGVQQHVLTEVPSTPVAFNMFNWAWANYQQVTGYNHLTLTSFNDTSALPNARQLSGVSNAANAFINCQNLTDVSPFVNLTAYGSGVNFARMFQYCQSVVNCTALGSWSTGNVTNMAYMFANCFSLTLADLANWNTGGVTNMTGMFYYCNKLAQTDIAGWNTSSVTAMQSMCYYCSNLTAAAMNSWNTSKVTNMSSMFYGCGNLSDINGLANWNTANVTNMYGVFYNCWSLDNVSALSGWRTNSATTVAYMFINCRKMTDISPLSGWNTSKATTFANVFYNCVNVTNISPVSGWNTGNVTTMAGMFGYGNNISNLTPLSGWNTSSVTNMSGMFIYCNNATSANLAGWDTSKVTSMYSMFSYCNKITDLSMVAGWNLASLTNGASLFHNCRNLTCAALPATLAGTSNCVITNMFRNCSNLQGNIFFNGAYVNNATDCFNGANLYSKNIIANRSVSGGTYDSFYTAMGNSKTNSSYWNATLYPLDPGLTISASPSSAAVTIAGSSRSSYNAVWGETVSWSVAASGYVTQSGSQTMYDDTSLSVTLAADNYTFTIVPDPSDATVTINGSVRTSYTAQAGTTVTWEVSRTGYVTQSGTYTLNSDYTLEVSLTPMLVSVTVNPTPSDATVTICETDSRGVKSCNEESSGSLSRYATAGDLIEWTVEKDGYKTQTGSFTIYEDTVIDVELKLDVATLYFTTRSALYSALTRVTVNGQVGDGTRDYGIPSFTFDGGTFVYWTVEVYGQSGWKGYRTTGTLILNSDTTIDTSTMVSNTHGTLNGAAVVYKDSVTDGYYTCSAAKWLEDSSYDVNAGRFSLCGVLVGDGSDEMVVATAEQSSLAWGEDGDTGGVMTTSQDTARADMAGKDNTSKGYSSELCRATAFAIGWVTDSFSGGDTGNGWWLPSDGECVFVNRQLSAINSVLSSIGTQITASSIRSMTPYWTSTQYSASSAWSFYFDLGSELGDTDRANRAIARPVSRLSSGVGEYQIIDE